MDWLKVRTLFFVLTIHIGIFTLFFEGLSQKIITPPRTKIAVRTKELSNPTKVTTHTNIAQVKTCSAPPSKPPLLRQGTIPKRPQTPQRPQQKRPQTRQSTQKKAIKPTPNKKILNQLDRKMALLQKNPSRPSNVKQSPSKNAPQNTEESISIFDRYIEQLASIFQSILTLPQSGKVKLTISVQPNGKIAKIGVISSESDANLEYLRKMLKTITLPTYDFQEQVEFTITFCDDA